MELYDPEFPCDSDVLDPSNNDKNEEENDSLNATQISNKDLSQIELSSIELPAAKGETNRGHVANSPGSKNKIKAAEEFSTSENEVHSAELGSNSVTENSLNRVDDADSEDLDDETSYRDELKRSAGGRIAKGSESKASKEVPLEMYLGPSVGFRVDLTINKSRKSSVESIAQRRHGLNDRDLFERLSPETHGKSKIKGKRADASLRNGNKIDIRLPKLGSSSANSGSDHREGGSEPQRTAPEASFEQANDANLEKSPQKRQPNSPIFSPLPQSVKAKPTGDHKSSETHSPQKSRSIESEKENVDSRRRKHNEPSSDAKKSTSRVESEHEISERDGRNGSPSVKSGHRDSHPNEKYSREKRHGKGDSESRHHAKDQENKRSRKDSGSKGRGRGHTKETDSTSDIESAPSRKKRRNSRSPSQGHKKMSVKKSKSNSPKRRRNKSQSRDNRIARRSRSRTRDQERLHEKKSDAKSKHSVRHLEDPRLEQATDKHRRHRSRSKSLAQDVESKRRKEPSRLSDFRESGFFCESWNYDARSSSKNHKTHARQSAARDLPDTGTNLFEACMRTRYKKHHMNDDPWRSRPRHDGVDSSQSLSRDYCQAAGVEYITVSDSDEGIVWSDNDDSCGNYSKLTTQRNSSKKLKYEDIYSTRGLQTNENRAPVKILKKKKKRHKKEKSLSPSEILAINLKRKEKARKRENLKITKSVSRSSLEPGEIDERSSVSSNDNIVESVLPSKRTVSLLGEDDGRRPPGDKIPIQIHVITSHGGDGREKEDATKDCHENVKGIALVAEEAESGEKVHEKQCLKSRKESRKPLGSPDKELPGDATVSSGNSSSLDERTDQTLKEIRKLLSKVENLESREEQTCETENSLNLGTKANTGENNVVAEVALETKEPKVGPQFSKQDDISSPVSQTIPGLGEPFPSPAKEKDKETEMSQASAKSIALSQPSFYQIKKKIQPEQTVPKSDGKTQKQQPGPLGGSSWRSTPLQSKEPEPKLPESPAMSPVNENVISATHQMPALVATNFPTLLTTTVSGSSFGAGLSAAGEEPPLPSPVPDHRSGKSGLQTSSASVLTNPFALNQNVIMDLLTPLQNPVLPSLSSLMHSTAPVTITTTDASLSKFLAAITPTVTPITSQKLIDNLLKASSVTLPELSAKSQALKAAAHSDDQFSSLLNMQKKLSDLSQISNVASHSSAPISQKLVQDIFKAVLPNISGVPDMSTLCPQPADIPCSLSDDDCMNEESMMDYRSPSFSPPSLPDRSSPGRNSDTQPLSQEMKGKGHRAKAKADALKSDGLVKEKMSKADIQKRVVEHVKSVIRPFYSKGRINKDEYKEIMRKTVPKICHSKTQDFSKTRITIYVEAYARKVMATRKYNAKKKDPE